MSKDEPPPYDYSSAPTTAPSSTHPWQAVPDTADRAEDHPPPPVLGRLRSEVSNASTADSDRALDYCNKNPLWPPINPPDDTYASVASAFNHGLWAAPEFRGRLQPRPGRWWAVRSEPSCGDCLLATCLPMYFAHRDSPAVTGGLRTIYFEVTIQRILPPSSSRQGGSGGGADASGLSLGYLALPYPTWRSPGWERGSLGVFSDDGARFVNDPNGGKAFTEPFRQGETVGLGMRFNLPIIVDQTQSGQIKRNSPLPPVSAHVFFTRNGREVGGWDVHEERDKDEGDVVGLEGDFDLYGAIGVFGGVEFEACFAPDGLLWRESGK
ncbi:hypothetical protein VTN31DRAFT_3746 [Thermomyces dupontii]|uniref:uncharacterized protein n=1 Tax=Talaromyces thermophilus TaxID=28565 RepID=UPI003742DE95